VTLDEGYEKEKVRDRKKRVEPEKRRRVDAVWVWVDKPGRAGSVAQHIHPMANF
jgi:hypothetical protein